SSGLRVRLQRERAEVGAALAGEFPGQVQAGAFERGDFSECSEGALHAGQRRAKILLVAAEMILAGEGAGRDVHEPASFYSRAGTAGALAVFHLDGRCFHGGDLRDETAAAV